MAGVIVLANVPLGSTGPGSSVVVVGSSPLLGRPAPQIALAGLGGEPVSLADYQGRPVIVNFWASWCIPCRDEFPLLASARAANAAGGLEILGVVYKDTADGARAFAADHDGTWPMPLDAQNAAAAAYGVQGVPMSFFVDPGGVVRAVSFGPLTAAGLAQQLATIMPAAVAPGAPGASGASGGAPSG